jgi:Tol biopolymer transport system component
VKGDTDLLSELQQRSEKDGLALARVAGNVVDVIPFGSDRKQCFLGDAIIFAVGFSSDGLKVVLADYQQNLTIKTVDGEVLTATSALKFPNMLAWLSPDGKQLLFSTARNSSIPPLSGLYLADLTSNRVELLDPEVPHAGIDAGFSKSAGWARDGTSIVYSREGQIFHLDLRTRSKSTLAKGTSPSWSPDGKWIAYKAEDGTARLMAFDGSNQTNIMPGRPILGYLHWSPDSEYLLFSENHKPNLLEFFRGNWALRRD